MKTTNFPAELEKLKILINRIIKLYLRPQYPYEHYRLTYEYSRRAGKRLRGALVILGAGLYGGRLSETFLTAAIMETMQDWLLIHDDFFDNSLTRRGRPTLNKSAGAEMAVNAGDALHALNWKMLGDNVRFLGAKRGWKVFYKINEILTTTLAGQFLELKWRRTHNFSFKDKDYFNLIYHKTAVYSIIGPLQLGALIAGNGYRECAAINQWAKPLGYAFQIRDDILNLRNNEKIYDKDKRGDLYEGKITLILKNLLDRATLAEKERIILIYKKTAAAKTLADINYLDYLIKKYNCLDYAQNIVMALINKARAEFLKIYNQYPASWAKNTLLNFMDFLATRNY